MDNDKENIIQAVVVMDNFNSNFTPINKYKPMGLFSLAGVNLVDFVLESLALGGVGEAILYCCHEVNLVREHIKQSIKQKSPWTLTMDVQVLSSDTCRTMGDVMREIDASGLVRGYFILMGVNCVANIPFGSLLEQHKQICKKDKGAAMTLVYKKLHWEHPLIKFDKQIFLAADGNSNKVLIHKKIKHSKSEKGDIKFHLPLEIVLNHSEVKLHHDLADANIALCSPSVPPLFSDNFDFQNRDDFIHGVLINEEILASTLYYVTLKSNQYAAAITNWKTFKHVSCDILHNWAHPLNIETKSFNKNNFVSLRNYNYKHVSSTLSRFCELTENVLIGAETNINDKTTISNSFIGMSCKIGKNVTISGSHIMNNVVIKDNCSITNSFIDDNCEIKENSKLENGVIIGCNVVVEADSKLSGSSVESTQIGIVSDESVSKILVEGGTDWENESTDGEDDEIVGFDKQWSDSDSNYLSDDSEVADCPILDERDDTNIFLQEVIDSLARGYDEKFKCDYLILEINSSRYAYNIQLHEVNFFVVRAILSIPALSAAKNVLATAKDILKYFRPVLANYIKTKSSIEDCLRAVEDCCTECEWLSGKAGQLLHLLYDADVVDEDSLTKWFKELKENESCIANQPSLVKFFEWLQEASEESEESE